MSNYEYVIPTTTPKNEQYYTLKQVPGPKYMGGRGEYCLSSLDCHENLNCIDSVCRDWIPSNVGTTNAVKERFTGVLGDDYYKLSPDYDAYPITTKASSQLKYTSKQKANSGRNYW